MAKIKKIARKSVKLAAKSVIQTLPTLPGRPGRLTGKLAKEGGLPVRDTRFRPWPSSPSTSLVEWTTKLSPKFLQIFLSGVEGLPQPLANQFCSEWASYCGARHALLLPHGTDALRVAITAAMDHDAMEYGGEIVVPNLSFIASATTALDRRFGVVLVDVRSRDLSNRSKACGRGHRSRKDPRDHGRSSVWPTADMTALADIAKRHSLVLLEDAAQAHGAIHELGRVGAIGAAAVSFPSSKNLIGR
jgi:hypothetical protein